MLVLALILLTAGCGPAPGSAEDAARPDPSAIALIDRPALDPAVVPEPTVGPTMSPPGALTASSVEGSRAPARLIATAIGLDQPVLPVGLTPVGDPIVPRHEVGWYSLGAAPGDGDNVVLWGHVLRFRAAPQTPAPFARVHELRPGDVLTLVDSSGERLAYAVDRQVWATPDQVEYILPRGREQLTLVSCIGAQVVSDGALSLSHRLITIAIPVERAYP